MGVGESEGGFAGIVPSSVDAKGVFACIGAGVAAEEDGPVVGAAPAWPGTEPGGGGIVGGLGDEGVVVEEGGWNREDGWVGAVVANQADKGRNYVGDLLWGGGRLAESATGEGMACVERMGR